MTWRMKHKLFGWDYIALYGNTGAYRIYVDGEGKPYIDRNGYYQHIKNESSIYTWLTCPPSKYIKGELK